LAFVRKHDDGASVAAFDDDRRFAERFNFRSRKVNGEVLTTFGVPNEAVDFVRIRNENRSDRAADADASVPDRDVDGLLFEKFPNRVSKLIFHNILSFYSLIVLFDTRGSPSPSAVEPFFAAGRRYFSATIAL
jgi:hypothetical protein